MPATPEQAAALRLRLRNEGMAKYPNYAQSVSWPYLGDDFYFNVFRQDPTEDQVSQAFWMFLDPWQGNAYNAFVGTHDMGAGIYYYLAFGDPNGFVRPAPIDTRYAPPNDAVQLGYMALGEDAYGNKLSETFVRTGQQNIAAILSNRPGWLWTTPNDTIQWLLFNNFVTRPFDRFAWTPYFGKTIAECVIEVEKVNHPGWKP